MLDTLVGGIAHELNNKLTPVLGFAGLLSVGTPEQQRNYVEYIKRGVVEAAGIIRQLLQLSKPHVVDQQFTDLGKTVDEAMVMLKFRLREAGVTARLNQPDQPVMILADSGQIKQVIINLAMSAIQAMQQRPTPTLEVDVGRQDDSAFVRVRDNGTGIAPENMPSIFDPFFTTKQPDRGTGLGLSICFSIMRQHGGDITVESEVGRGRIFRISLPLALSSVPPAIVSDQLVAPALRIASRSPFRHVLVIEDEEVVRRVVHAALRSFGGCSIDCVADGREALRAIENRSYDLIVSNVRMPNMSGTELYRELLQHRPELTRRLLFATGHVALQEESEDIERWQVPVVAKPFSIESLIEACRPFPAAEPGAKSA